MPCIGGIRSVEATEEIAQELARLLSSQKHRDPQAAALSYRAPEIALGMLNSQNDIYGSSTADPLQHRGVFAVIDGVVLGWSSLRTELAAEGIDLENPSCAQIIAAAYSAWDLGFMEHLDGEFACAVWDSRKHRLVIARDPYGAKCLHYAVASGRFVFSSEIKGILATGHAPRVDQRSLSDFLSLNGIPAPGTMFEGIFQVLPGTMQVVDWGSPREQRYFSAVIPPRDSITEDEAKEELCALMRSAVRKRLLRHEAYSFLSGGLDSSCVVSFAKEIHDGPLHSISVGFDEGPFNELPAAAEMATHAGTIHHAMTCKPEEFFSSLDTLIFHHDIPFYDTSALPTYQAAKLASQHTSLILTGDGPDQLLGSGNHVFAVRTGLFDQTTLLQRLPAYELLTRLLRFAPAPRKDFLSKAIRRLYRATQSPVRQYYDLKSSFPEWVKETLCTPELLRHHRESHPYRFPESWFEQTRDLDPLGQMLYADVVYYLGDDLVIKVDRMCRANGLETVSPFLDKAVSRFLISLPSELRMKVDEKGEVIGKYILRKVAEDRLPASLLARPKQGFAMPLDSWLRHDGGAYLRSILYDRRALTRGYFKEKAVRTFVEDFLSGRCDYYYAPASAVMMLLNTELWHRMYIDSNPFAG